MKRISKKHDLINIRILDQSEWKLPKLGLMKMHDSENKNAAWVDTNNSDNHVNISNNIYNKKNYIANYCRRNNIDLISINTKYGYIEPLVKFFNSRSSRQ